MTEQEVTALGPAFAVYLRRFRGCLGQDRTAGHFGTYCRGLLTDLPRKTVEPIALEAGTAVRTLQEFLVTARWDHDRTRDTLQQHRAGVLGELPADPLGTVGVIDETSCQKWGDQTPGVQRQYLGGVGKIDNGIVTVHIAVAKGTFPALLDADLYLPESWAADRKRCRAAGIPDAVGYRSKWRIALDQWMRLRGNGVAFDWLTFDEGYGSKVPFLWVLGLVGQRFVAEVPKNFAAKACGTGVSRRADDYQPGTTAARWTRFRLSRKTQADQVWRATGRRVWAADGWHQLVTAVSEKTGEAKFFVTHAVDHPLERVLRVAFRRATVEHAFRSAKREAGPVHYEGRHYTGLLRHLILSLIVLGFVSGQTQRLRGEKSRDHGGASLSGVGPAVWGSVPPSPGRSGTATYERGHPVSSTAEQTGDAIPQEAAA